MSIPDKKVLFVAYYFPPLGMGGTQRVAKWCKYLTRWGWQVTVITVKPISYYATDESLLAEVASARVIRTESFDPARVLYLLHGKGSATQNKPTKEGRSRLLYWFLLPDPRILWLPFALWHAWRCIRREGIRHVVTSGPPHSSHFVGWLLKRFCRIRWICDYRDAWQRDEFAHQIPTLVHRWIHSAMEKAIVRRADAVIAVSMGLTKQLHELGNRREGTIHFLPNGYDPEDFGSVSPTDDESFQVTYVGAVSSIQDPRPLLAGFRAFIETSQLIPKEARLNFVGADVTGRLPEWINEQNLSDYVHFTGYLPHREAVAELCRASLLVFIANPGTHRTIIGSKTFEYLAAHKPVLAIGEEIEGVSILRKYAPCRHCEFEDVGAITRALLAFFKEIQTGELALPASAPVEFSRENQTRKLEEIILGGESIMKSEGSV